MYSLISHPGHFTEAMLTRASAFRPFGGLVRPLHEAPKLTSGDEGSFVAERLSKMIASTGYCSRREADELIREGRVVVNGAVAGPTTRVSDRDRVFVEDIPLRKGLSLDPPRLWLVHKRRGELVATSDPVRGRPLMLERVRRLGVPATAVPVNRLEFNAEGACLVTDNLAFARFMEGPDSGVSREYKVRVHGLVTQSKLEGLRRGLFINGIKFKPMRAAVVPHRSPGANSWLSLGVDENRSKVLKTCLEKLYLKPLRVICTAYGPFKIDSVAPGGVVEPKLPLELNKKFVQFQLRGRRV